MFLALESSKFREAKIRSWIRNEHSVALLVAAAHFEWTVCRALLLLSERTNRQIREDLVRVYGLDRYKDFWNKELCHVQEPRSLPQIVTDWSAVTRAFDARNRLVHGRDRYTRNMATPHVDALLQAAADVREYCSKRGANFEGRLPIRRKERLKRNQSVEPPRRD